MISHRRDQIYCSTNIGASPMKFYCSQHREKKRKPAQTTHNLCGEKNAHIFCVLVQNAPFQSKISCKYHETKTFSSKSKHSFLLPKIKKKSYRYNQAKKTLCQNTYKFPSIFHANVHNHWHFVIGIDVNDCFVSLQQSIRTNSYRRQAIAYVQSLLSTNVVAPHFRFFFIPCSCIISICIQ